MFIKSFQDISHRWFAYGPYMLVTLLYDRCLEQKNKQKHKEKHTDSGATYNCSKASGHVEMFRSNYYYHCHVCLNDTGMYFMLTFR